MRKTEVIRVSIKEIPVRFVRPDLSSERLSYWTILCFSLPSFGLAAMEMPLTVHLPRLYARGLVRDPQTTAVI